MSFELDSAAALLERTPSVLDAFVRDLPEGWTTIDEGPDTWTVIDVLGHLVHGERTDWIPRARIILHEGEATPFPPFDRFAQMHDGAPKDVRELLDEFRRLRRQNLDTLRGWQLTPATLNRSGTHPEFGRVTLGELIATWTVHDLTHLAQIARVMAKRYDRDVGPWKTYLRILHS